jgi:phosphoribosylformimino-5-aminoimidazole carboxamide ribotide isomerase
MKIFPAIDLKGAQVVRLLRGDYDAVQHYEIAPADAARDFAAKGAKFLHVVDLDGAKDGEMSNYAAVTEILAATDMFVEVGGGIRDMARIERYLTAGAARVILGTAAVRNPAFLREAVAAYSAKIAVGVDARDGFVAVNGWTETTAVRGTEFCRNLRDMGVKTVIYTDISRDGAMSGTNLELYAELTKIEGLDIIASGGVSYIDEISRLAAMDISGAIVGKAIYSGALALEDVIKSAGVQE